MGQCDFSSIMKVFLTLLPQLLEDFFQKVLVAFGEYEMAQDKKSFACKCCGNDTKFIWKTRHGKATTILTWFRYITLKQLQVQCKVCGSKQYLTRMLLGMEPRKRIPEETRRKLLDRFHLGDWLGGGRRGGLLLFGEGPLHLGDGVRRHTNQGTAQLSQSLHGGAA